MFELNFSLEILTWEWKNHCHGPNITSGTVHKQLNDITIQFQLEIQKPIKRFPENENQSMALGTHLNVEISLQQQVTRRYSYFWMNTLCFSLPNLSKSFL